jgi:hypothetical protein
MHFWLPLQPRVYLSARGSHAQVGYYASVSTGDETWFPRAGVGDCFRPL